MSHTRQLSPERTHALVERFSRVSILIAGDVMLDHFLVGSVDRISPEAPVPVVVHDHDDYRVGGAANVAHNARALGATAELVGVVGMDSAADELRQLLDAQGIGTTGLAVDPSRRTTTKLRIVTNRNQQVARIDYETDEEISGEVEDAVRANIRRLGAAAHLLVVSDYLKGVVTRGVVEDMVGLGRSRRLPVLVDPKIPHIDYYRGDDAGDAEPPRGRDRLAHQGAERRRRRAGGRGLPRARRVRARADHARRARHEPARRAEVAPLPLDGARSGRRDRRRRHGHCHAGAGRRGRSVARARPRRWPITPPASWCPEFGAATVAQISPHGRAHDVDAGQPPSLVPEVPPSREDHGEAVFVGGGDHLGVTHRSARLDRPPSPPPPPPRPVRRGRERTHRRPPPSPRADVRPRRPAGLIRGAPSCTATFTASTRLI